MFHISHHSQALKIHLCKHNHHHQIECVSPSCSIDYDKNSSPSPSPSSSTSYSKRKEGKWRAYHSGVDCKTSLSQLCLNTLLNHFLLPSYSNRKEEGTWRKTNFCCTMNLAQSHDEPCSEIHMSILAVGFVNSHWYNFLEESGRIFHATTASQFAMLFTLKPHSPADRSSEEVSTPIYLLLLLHDKTVHCEKCKSNRIFRSDCMTIVSECSFSAQ